MTLEKTLGSCDISFPVALARSWFKAVSESDFTGDTSVFGSCGRRKHSDGVNCLLF